MAAKLTLSINEKTIERAKRISRKRGKSVSKMVEEYLDSISEKVLERESSVKKISGVLKGRIPENANLKKIKEEHIIKKYGL